MITKNYRIMIGNALVNSATTSGMIDTNGDAYSVNTAYIQQAFAHSNSYFPMGLELGTGTTPATDSDYNLESKVSLTSVSKSKNYGNASYVYTLTQGFINNTDSAITVSEIGLMFYDKYAPDTTRHKDILLGRIVLDNPIVIAPGEIYTFSYTIR